MPCTGEDLLIKLRKEAEEKSRPFKESVEKHFLWLEEVLVEFTRALEDKGPTLLPKTPSAKRARDVKPSKPGVETIGEDGDENDPETRSPAAKKSLVGNFENISVTSPPRRGRAASKAAALKVKENLKELSNIGAKKRRPSVTESESSAEKKVVSKKKRRVRSKEPSQAPIETRDEKEQIETEEHLPSPGDLIRKETQEPSRKSSASNKKACLDEKKHKYLPVVVPEDSGGGIHTSTTKAENKASLEVKEKFEDKRNSSFEEKKNSTAVEKEEPGVELRLNDSECSLKLDDSENEEDVIVTETATASDAIVPEALDKSKNSDKQAAVPVEKLASAVGTDREPSVEEVGKSQEPDVHIEEPDTGAFVSTETIKDRRLTAIVSVTQSESQERVRKTEDRTVADEIESQESDATEVETKPERVVRSTRTKTRNALPAQEVDEPVRKTRVTRSKLRNSPQGVEIAKPIGNSVFVPSVIVTCPETEETDGKARGPCETEEDKPQDMLPPEEVPKTRSTRTKKKEAEVTNNHPVRSTRTKQKRLENESGRSCSQDSAICSGEASSEESESEVKVQATAESSYHQNVSSASAEVEVAVPARRMTRSKVRQLANVTPATPPSPKATSSTNKGSFSHDFCTPKSDIASPLTPIGNKSPKKFDPRPFAPIRGKGTVKEMAVAYQKHISSAREVEEVQMQEIHVTHSPARATHHPKGSSTKTAKISRINQAKMTPSYSKDRILHVTAHRLESSNSSSSKSGSSGRLKSRFRAVNTSINSGKRMSSLASGTPTKVRRHHNILSGMSSFVTKVQPLKPTREELEEKRQEELRRKREREEETRRKKDELLKIKAEEQKRKNEERMRKVQEAREARERKVFQAKEQQERERRMKEERYREEQLRKKQQHILKKKAEEEARLQKLKEQMEEEELQRAEEQKRREMQRVEEEKQLLMAAQKMKEELERKKREMERIGREKLELERLKQREIERYSPGVAATKVAATAATSHQKPVLNETYTAEDDKENTNLNSTYTKPNQEQSSSVKGYSNEAVPQKIIKTFNPADNYNIRDIRSDDSTDDEEKPKKIIPAWAQGTQLKNALIRQVYYPPDIDLIFSRHPSEPLDLSKIFHVKKKRFYSRTSSAVWSTPPSKLFS